MYKLVLHTPKEPFISNAKWAVSKKANFVQTIFWVAGGTIYVNCTYIRGHAKKHEPLRSGGGGTIPGPKWFDH